MQIRLFIRAIISLLVVQAGLIIASPAQEPPFFNDIQAFKKKDSISFPPRNAILFVGSSSFTLWENVQGYFPGYKIINRGFGGSTLTDVIRYADDIIFPYQPKQIVIYCGENDIAVDSADSKEVGERFKKLFTLIREKLPTVFIVYVSIKPSPSREKYLPVMRQSNQIIKNFLWQQRNVIYVNVFDFMLDVTGKPREELFLEDRLHMNEKGYAIWQKAIRPFLLK